MCANCRIYKSIEINVKSEVTIGLGYIGLPTSALIASQGKPVFGVDINQNVVDTINKGEIHIVEPELDGIVKKAVEKGLLKAGTKARPSDVYLIVVPTPFKEDHEPADHSEVKKEYSIDLIPFIKDNYDGILLAVAHDEFNTIDLSTIKIDNTSVVFDLKGFFPKDQVSPRL